jgi:hypothetical protein
VGITEESYVLAKKGFVFTNGGFTRDYNPVEAKKIVDECVRRGWFQ